MSDGKHNMIYTLCENWRSRYDGWYSKLKDYTDPNHYSNLEINQKFSKGFLNLNLNVLPSIGPEYQFCSMRHAKGHYW